MNIALRPFCPSKTGFPVRLAFASKIALNHVMARIMVDVSANRRSAEELLVAVAERRDKSAFAALLDMWGGRIKSYLLRSGMTHETAEDLVQEVFLTVWQKAGTYKPTLASASTWLFTIARNKRIDRIRSEKHIEIGMDILPDAVNNDNNSDNIYDHGLTAQYLQKNIQLLPPEQRQLIELAFFEDLSHSEIAAGLNLPLGTIKSRLRLAFHKLRHGLNPDLISYEGRE